MFGNNIQSIIDMFVSGDLDSDSVAPRLGEIGQRLAESEKWSPYCEKIKDDDKRGLTAIMLHNQETLFNQSPGYKQHRQIQEMQKQLNQLTEVTTTSDIATIDRVSFPIIRALAPNFIANDLVAVQPMLGPTSPIVYMRSVYTNSKGVGETEDHLDQDLEGKDPTEVPDPWYGSHYVNNEVIAVAAAAAQTHTAGWTPIRPGSLTVLYKDGTNDTVVLAKDDGNGNLTGNALTGNANTVNYESGALAFTLATAATADDKLWVSYEYNSEMVDGQVPEIDIQLNTSQVTAEEHKLRVRWSVESQQNLYNLYGMSAEVEFGAMVANDLKRQTDRRILDHVQGAARAQGTRWDGQLPQGVSWIDHKQEFEDVVTAASLNILHKTKQSEGNWIVMGTNVAKIVHTLPAFTKSGPTGVKGARETGTLGGSFRCFVDPHRRNYPTNEKTDANVPSAVYGRDSYTVGLKSGNLMEAGVVFAPYIALYMTPTTTLDDFISRKGFSTQFAIQTIDGDYYSNGYIDMPGRNVTGYPANDPNRGDAAAATDAPLSPDLS